MRKQPIESTSFLMFVTPLKKEIIHSLNLFTHAFCFCMYCGLINMCGWAWLCLRQCVAMLCLCYALHHCIMTYLWNFFQKHTNFNTYCARQNDKQVSVRIW